ncbi:NAD(P)H-dependent oxidoreductase [Sphingobacterium daejeonense]|uniref:flavodoxin n=1 Tax=Sphingobacterium daejeonense TaxID=371142 RepID=UPI0021A8E6EA|nr:flavodoxin [Sphingobacterium daejeonense]MCT1532111.1 NAD(P)H-dependent oxidoreductase [Sphingobacterium daejeonense]
MAEKTNNKNDNPVKVEKLNDYKILIVYLSRTKNTQALAEIIHENLGGDLHAVELLTSYPEDYQTMVDQVAEENSSGYLPPLKTKIENIKDYDVVFVGFPTWGMQLPPPVKSFLKEYDLTGKIVVPFNSNAGYGIGNSFETVKLLCPNSRILEGYSTQGGKEKDGVLFVMEGDKEKQVQIEIKNWLIKIKSEIDKISINS